MSGNITFLVYRIEWHRRRAEALHAARSGLCRELGELPSCKIYWAADSFAHRSSASAHSNDGPIAGANPGTTERATPNAAKRATDRRDPCTIADLQDEPD